MKKTLSLLFVMLIAMSTCFDSSAGGGIEADKNSGFAGNSGSTYSGIPEYNLLTGQFNAAGRGNRLPSTAQIACLQAYGDDCGRAKVVAGYLCPEFMNAPYFNPEIMVIGRVADHAYCASSGRLTENNI